MRISSQNASFRGKNCDFEKLLPQRFSIPSSILYYITKDPTSPTVYQKLTQSCKYFYEKNRLLVVDRIKLVNCKVKVYQEVDKGMPYLTIKPHQILCKFWVTQTADICCLTDAATETLLFKMFRVNELWFYSQIGNPTIVRLDSILSPKTIESVKKVTFYNTYPKLANGTMMPVENVFEFFPNVEDFTL